MYTVGILTASDKASKGERVDESGKVIIDILKNRKGYDIKEYLIVPDEFEEIKSTLIKMSENLGLNVM